jgi:hypothetical protein
MFSPVQLSYANQKFRARDKENLSQDTEVRMEKKEERFERHQDVDSTTLGSK